MYAARAWSRTFCRPYTQGCSPPSSRVRFITFKQNKDLEVSPSERVAIDPRATRDSRLAQQRCRPTCGNDANTNAMDDAAALMTWKPSWPRGACRLCLEQCCVWCVGSSCMLSCCRAVCCRVVAVHSPVDKGNAPLHSLPVTQSVTQSLTHPPTHPLTHSLTHPQIHSPDTKIDHRLLL